MISMIRSCSISMKMMVRLRAERVGCVLTSFLEDVWDEDSAYLEMLAKEVCELRFLLHTGNLTTSRRGLD